MSLAGPACQNGRTPHCTAGSPHRTDGDPTPREGVWLIQHCRSPDPRPQGLAVPVLAKRNGPGREGKAPAGARKGQPAGQSPSPLHIGSRTKSRPALRPSVLPISEMGTIGQQRRLSERNVGSVFPIWGAWEVLREMDVCKKKGRKEEKDMYYYFLFLLGENTGLLCVGKLRSTEDPRPH